MATIKAEYYRLNGNTWDKYYFKTTADMVEGLDLDNKLQATQANLQYGKIYRSINNIPHPDSGTTNVDIVINYPNGWSWGFVEVEIFKNYSHTSYTGYIKRSWLLNRGPNEVFSNSEISTIVQGDIGEKIYVEDIVRINETTDVISLSAKSPLPDGYGIIVRLVSLATEDISVYSVVGGRQTLETRTNVNTYAKTSDIPTTMAWSKITSKPSGILREVSFSNGIMTVETI